MSVEFGWSQGGEQRGVEDVLCRNGLDHRASLLLPPTLASGPMIRIGRALSRSASPRPTQEGREPEQCIDGEMVQMNHGYLPELRSPRIHPWCF